MHRTIWAAAILALISITARGADQAAAETHAAAPIQASSGYVLGPNDQITLSVVELPEFNGKPYRIDEDGTVSLPLVGRVQAAGLTLAQLEAKLCTALGTQEGIHT